jgi:hypothetical protein
MDSPHAPRGTIGRIRVVQRSLPAFLGQAIFWMKIQQIESKNVGSHEGEPASLGMNV